jgi:hypothetical protein
MDGMEARVAEQIRRCIESIEQAQRLIDETTIFLSRLYQRSEFGFTFHVAAWRFISQAQENLQTHLHQPGGNSESDKAREIASRRSSRFGSNL